MSRSRISLDDANANNIGVLQKINEVFDVKFDDKWYRDSLEKNQGNYVQYAYFKEIAVAAVKARVITKQGKPSGSFVYLDTIAVLPAYRNLGIAKKLLQWLVEQCGQGYIHEIQCHVWVDNSQAIAWYEKNGFVKGQVVKDYYKQHGFSNPDAYIFTLAV